MKKKTYDYPLFRWRTIIRMKDGSIIEKIYLNSYESKIRFNALMVKNVEEVISVKKIEDFTEQNELSHIETIPPIKRTQRPRGSV